MQVFADSPEYSKREEIIKTHNAEKAAKDKIDKLNMNQMNKEVLKVIELELKSIGDTMISGNEAWGIIQSAVEYTDVPEEVQRSIDYIRECNRDLGFMGSPEYSRHQDVVSLWDAKESDRKKLDKLQYYKLKARYGRE